MKTSAIRCAGASLFASLILTACASDNSAKHAQLLDGSPERPIGAIRELPEPRVAQRDTDLAIEMEDFKKFDQPGEGAQFFIDQRLPIGKEALPIDDLVEAAENLKLRKAQAAAQRGATSAPGDVSTWKHLGPGNVGGRTRTIAIDPVTPSTIYAAGVNGGVWKSLDSGASWVALDDLLPNLAVSALTIDPLNPNVLYAGTGEGVFPGAASPMGAGIFKSTDAGVTWTLLPSTANPIPSNAFDYVNKIVISANDSNRIYAATRTGVWRSLNAGVGWDLVLANPRYISGPQQTNGCNTGCLDLVARTDTNPDVLLAAFGSFESDGIYRSVDGGATWTELTTGSTQGRMNLAIAPSNQNVMYICMADNGTGAALGQLIDVFRSTDGGATWQPRVDFAHPFGPWLLSNLATATGCFPYPVYSQGWHDNVIEVDPMDPDIVWVGGVDLFRSDDGGQTFGVASYWFGDQTLSVPIENYTHADNHFIAFHPDYDGVDNQIMYLGSDGGLYCTDNARAATSQEDCPIRSPEPQPAIDWIDLNNGYAVTQFYHGDAAKEADIFAAGAQDNGTNLVASDETPDSWSRIFGGDGGYVAIDPTNSDVMYVEIQFFPEIRKSIDGGFTFNLAVNGITDTDGVFIVPFAMDQNDPEILWTGGSRPWRTTNGAALWELAGPNFAGADKISAVAIAPTDSETVYLGFSNGYIARTNNALDASPTWSVLSTGLPLGGWVSSVAVDPVDPTVVYCTYSNFGISHVFRSTNSGTTWTSIDGLGDSGLPNIPVHWIEVRPNNSNQLYVATELGVFTSDDAGATWQVAGDNFPTTVVESLDFKDENTLVAFTHGRGAFLADLNQCPADIDGDGVVGSTDLALLLGFWGSADSSADLDGDGVVGSADLAQLIGSWGPCP